MSSHIHYGLLAGVVDPDRFFRSAHTRFAQRYHRSTQHTLGPVFAERPKLHTVEQADLQRLVAYHHRNPVEAGVVQRPSQSSWTSHRAYLRLDPPPNWLDVERSLDLLGFRDTAAGRRHFDEFVTEIDMHDRPLMPKRKQAVETSRRGTDVVDWSLLVDLAREVTGLPHGEPLSSKSYRAALTRRLIAILATRELGQTYANVAAQLEMTTGSAYNLVTRRGSAENNLEEMLAELRRRFLAR
jgi:hypothetical protein